MSSSSSGGGAAFFLSSFLAPPAHIISSHVRTHSASINFNSPESFALLRHSKQALVVTRHVPLAVPGDTLHLAPPSSYLSQLRTTR
jgi:hypothetical protein